MARSLQTEKGQKSPGSGLNPHRGEDTGKFR